MEYKTSWLLNLVRWCTFERIELKDGYVLQKYKCLGIIPLTGNAIKAEKAVFFDQAQGLTGKSISFGGLEKTIEDKMAFVKVGGVDYWNYSTMDIVGLNKNAVEEIRQYLLDNGARLEDTNAVEYKSKVPIFKFWRWFCPREIIRVGDNGILHTFKNLRKSKSSFIPYDDLKMFVGRGLFRKQLTILGDVSVITKERFSNQVYKELNKKLGDFTKLLCSEGKTYRASILSLRSRKSQLIVLNQGFVYTSKKQAGFFEYSDVDEFFFEKYHWWGIFGKFTVVVYRDDARSSSWAGGNFSTLDDSSHDFVVPGLPVWKWRVLFFFRGPLKKTFKVKCKEAKKAARRERREVRKAERNYFKSNE